MCAKVKIKMTYNHLCPQSWYDLLEIVFSFEILLVTLLQGEMQIELRKFNSDY